MASMSDDLTALEERFNLRLAAELADVRGELRTGLAEVRTEIAEFRGDVEATLRSQTWTIVTTMMGLMIGLAGIVFTIARFT
jgi:hypothetical protein